MVETIFGIPALWYLSLVLWLPLVGALGLALVSERAARGLALVVALVEAVLGALLLLGPGAAGGSMDWLPAFGLRYALQVDALALPFVLLAAGLLVVAVAAPPSWRAALGERNPGPVRGYYAALLALTTGMLGVFLAGSVFLFYIFWELMLLPAYYLLARFARVDAPRIALRFVLYTLAGGLLMLVGLLGMGATADAHGAGFNPDALLGSLAGQIESNTQFWLFAAILAGVVVKIPLVPFHSWQPESYAEAPAPVAVILAGVMAKTAIYVLIRFGVLVFPAGALAWQPVVATLAVISIVYGALAALAAREFPRVVAYVSLSHMGFLALGVAAGTQQALAGAVLQAVNHGVIIAGLFLLAAMLERRASGARSLAAYGGWAARWPRLATVFLLVALGALGLPGLSGFSGEFLILLGTYRVLPWAVVVALVGVILAAWYAVRFYQATMHGPETPATGDRADLTRGEALLLAPLLAAIVIIGLAPGLITGSLFAWLGTLRLP